MISPHVNSFIEKLRARLDEKRNELEKVGFVGINTESIIQNRKRDIDSLEEFATRNPSDPTLKFVDQTYKMILEGIEEIEISDFPRNEEVFYGD